VSLPRERRADARAAVFTGDIRSVCSSGFGEPETWVRPVQCLGMTLALDRDSNRVVDTYLANVRVASSSLVSRCTP
jgi:hypothetical protein